MRTGRFFRDAARAVVILAVAAGLGLPAMAAGQAGDAVALRDAAGRRVCLVTAENALGIPLSYASGFLLGEGRFVVTDLASLAQPGVKQASLRFRDGTVAVARQFGMADPATGLVVVQLEQPPAGAAGLTFADVSTAEGPVEATVVGWKWGQDLDLTVGRVSQPLAASVLAARLKMEAPADAASFLNFEGMQPEEASGSPVFDRGGGVLGVLLQVAGFNKALVVPSAALRKALLASDRQLKPLSELPKPVWPIATAPVPGKPVAPGDFAQAVRTIKLRSRCARCSGKGTVRVEKIVGTTTLGGITQKIVRTEDVTCTACRGEGVFLADGFYAQYVRMAEGGTWMALAGDVDPKARDAAFSNSLAVLRAIGKVSRRYRDALVQQARTDLAKPPSGGPRGLVVLAHVRELADGPDGQYVLFTPHLTTTLMAARADQMSAVGEFQGAKLDVGRWIVLAGMGFGPVTLGDQKPLYVRPVAWVEGPNLGGSPRHDHPGTGPTTPGPSPEPTTPSTPGPPNFFGL